MLPALTNTNRLFVKQVFEMAEFFGFESRNKYRIMNEHGEDVAYAAEQNKGLLGFFARQFLGHWRTFEIHFYTPSRQEFMTAYHPFRFFFQRLELVSGGRPVGIVERRWSILTKRFDVQDANGQTLMEVSSPVWRPWTFPFIKQGQEVACIKKKWSGIGFELFTDRDDFLIEMKQGLSAEERSLITAAALFVDLMYFERKA